MASRCTAAFSLALWTVLAASAPATAIMQGEPDRAPAPREVGIRVRAIDLQGRPIAGAHLTIGPKDSATSRIPDAALAVTGDDGWAHLAWRPPAVAAAQTAENENNGTDTDGLEDRLFVLGSTAVREVPASVGNDGRDVLLLFAKGYASLARALPAEPDPDRPLDFGTVVLHRAGPLFGRVRRADGSPLAGATVQARDHLRANTRFRSRSMPWEPVCTAVSDSGGIFSLPGSFAHAVDVTVRAEGFRSQVLEAVSQTTPLEIELNPVTTVRGRLLDPMGRGVEGTVVVVFERSTKTQSAPSADDGFFELVLEHAGRFSILGRKTGFEPAWRGPLTADGVPLDLTLGEAAQPVDDTNGPGDVQITALDENGTPIPGARTAIAWSVQPATAPYYREYRLHQALRGSAETADDQGVVRIPGPASANKAAGYTAVLAEGYALSTEPIDWNDATEIDDDGTLELAVARVLPREAVLAGTVVDGTSGQPIADADLWAVPAFAQHSNYFNNPDQILYRTRSDENGLFAVRHLAAGSYVLRCRIADRPELTPVTFELAAGETREGLRIEAPAGFKLRGTLTGCAIQPGWRARVQAGPELIEGSWNLRGMKYDLSGVPADAVPVDPDGHFEIAGLPKGHYMLELLVPGTGRNGAMLRMPLESFRMRGDLARTVDVSLDRPGQVRGRVEFAHTAVPIERLVVIHSVLSPGQMVTNLGNNDLSGSWATLAGDGSFEAAVARGRHFFRVVDVQCGLVLFAAEPIEVSGGQTVETTLLVDAVELDVTLTAGDGENPKAAVSRLEVRTLSDAQRELRGGKPNALTTRSNYDMGVGMDLRPDQTSVTLFVPPGEVALLARSNVDRMLAKPGERVSRPPPIATLEHRCASGDAPARLELDPGPPKESRDP